MKSESKEGLRHMIESIMRMEGEVLQAFQNATRQVSYCSSESGFLCRYYYRNGHLMNEQISGIDEAMDNLKYFKCNEFAKSVFNDVSRSSVSGNDSQISNKYADALAELATKKVKLKSMKYEKKNSKQSLKHC